MADDILEAKIGLGGIKLNIRALIRRLRGVPKSGPMSVVAERFLTLFESHGFARAQIQRILPQLTLDKLNSAEALLPALTNPVLEEVATLFNVRREWLDGVDDKIYPHLTCYKHPEAFFETLATLNLKGDVFPVRAFCTGKLDGRDGSLKPMALVMVEKTRDLGELEIFRYLVFKDAWDWGHYTCRIQIKAMVRVLNRTLDMNVPLYRVDARVLNEIVKGRCFPQSHMRGSVITEPSLEDYALSQNESKVAKECEELPEVLDYIQNKNLQAVPLGISRKCGFAVRTSA